LRAVGTLERAASTRIGIVTTSTLSAAFRDAVPLELRADLVEQCVMPTDRFADAWRLGLDAFEPAARRGVICVEIGAIAESVMTLLFEELGLHVFAELATAGVHGVDLLALTPVGQVLALEVKGTLRATARARLGRGRLRQMSLEWLSAAGNPQMVEWDLAGADVYGAIAHLNFARMEWRCVVSADCESWLPVRDKSELLDLSSLDAAAA
jgi:hypothetical protein